MSFISVEHPEFEIMKSDLDIYDNYLVLEKIIRTCYRSEGKMTELSHRAMIQKIIDNDHTAMLEHMSITVKLFVDRAICMENIRHRLASYAMSSTRYIDYVSGLKVVKPHQISMDDIDEISSLEARHYPDFIRSVSPENKQRVSEAFLFINSCRNAFINYCARIDNGAHRQEARGSLNNHTQAELVVTTNLREWLHIFKLRDAKAAHPDFRLIISAVRNRFAEKYPLVFSPSELSYKTHRKTEEHYTVLSKEGESNFSRIIPIFDQKAS